MTVEIEYESPTKLSAGEWQVEMARQIENNEGVPLSEISRQITGSTIVVRVDASLPSQAVKNILSDIETHLPNGSQHIETREV